MVAEAHTDSTEKSGLSANLDPRFAGLSTQKNSLSELKEMAQEIVRDSGLIEVRQAMDDLNAMMKEAANDRSKADMTNNQMLVHCVKIVHDQTKLLDSIERCIAFMGKTLEEMDKHSRDGSRGCFRDSFEEGF